MKTKKPIQAINTERLLKSIFPEDFKMVEDKQSNGYKFINLLYGAEIDEVLDRTRRVYNNSFIDSFDVSTNYHLYQVSLSGSPNTQNIFGDGDIVIKITTEDEFYNGDPTRVVFIDRYSLPINTGSYVGTFHLENSFESGFNTQCWSNITGVVGLEYIRSNERGSGYFLVFSPYTQQSAYTNSEWPAHRIEVGPNFVDGSSFDRKYGFFTGIKEQNFAKNGRYETLYPITERTLSGLYPMYRSVTDESGNAFRIPHYTPYLGWIKNESNTVIAVTAYSGEYYYDSSGKKTYYRTAYNNPYGYGNYTSAYLDLEHIPISGTLRVFDIDILDISGNAIEIPRSGKNIYYYKSDKMLIGNSGSVPGGNPDAQFDPVYLGYSTLVPSGKGFSPYSEGKPTTLYKTISWDYLHAGGGVASGSLQYLDGSGAITNKIKINNPQTRYMVEYRYKVHDTAKYITCLNANEYVSLESTVPVYSVDSSGQTIETLDYEFTKDPYKVAAGEKSKIITFDGIETRPYKKLYKLDFNIPLTLDEGSINGPLYINTKNSYIGFSNQFVPVESASDRNYLLNCPFDSNVSGNTSTERDLTGNSHTFVYQNSGSNKLIKINYDTYFGKKIIRGTGDSYFYINNLSIIKDYSFFHLGFKLRTPQTSRLIELYDNDQNKYIILEVSDKGRITIQSNGYLFTSRELFSFGSSHKEFILQYLSDNLSDTIPTFKLYYKDGNSVGFVPITLFSSQVTALTISSKYIQIFKNCGVDASFFKIFYEVQ